MYSAAPGTSFAIHSDPFMFIFMPFIISAASGGICFCPFISDMSMLVVNAYSLHVMPSMTCDLPVGANDESVFGPATGAAAAPAGGAGGVTT